MDALTQRGDTNPNMCAACAHRLEAYRCKVWIDVVSGAPAQARQMRSEPDRCGPDGKAFKKRA